MPEPRHIPKAQRATHPPSRERAEFKSHMTMVRFHVESAIVAGDKDDGEFFYAQLLEQVRHLSRAMGFKLE